MKTDNQIDHESLKNLFNDLCTNKRHHYTIEYYKAIQNLCGIYFDKVEDAHFENEINLLNSYINQLIKIEQIDDLRRLIPDGNLRGLFEPGFRNQDNNLGITINVAANILPNSLIIKIFEQYDKLDKIPINTVKLIGWLKDKITKSPN